MSKMPLPIKPTPVIPEDARPYVTIDFGTSPPTIIKTESSEEALSTWPSPDDYS